MSEHSFDPEVVALLEEISRSSSSTLLRTPKERLLRWVGRPEEVISPHGSYLSKAEKHLAGAYREQAASVLHAACVERLTQPGSGVFIESSRRPDRRQIDACTSRLLRRAPDEHGLNQLLLGHGEASASQLAAASLRLVPSDLRRIALGAAFFAEAQQHAAMRMFELVLAGRPTAIMRSLAHDNRGQVYCSQEDYSHSLKCCIEAVHAAEGRWKSIAWRMVVALQLGDKSEVTQSAKDLGGMHVSDESIDALIGFLQGGRQSKKWVPTLPSLKLVTDLPDSLPEEARRICDAFLPIHT